MNGKEDKIINLNKTNTDDHYEQQYINYLV